MTKQTEKDARQSKLEVKKRRLLGRKLRESEVELYKVFQEKSNEWFHLYGIQKEFDELSQTTVHRTLVKFHDLGLLEKVKEAKGKRIRHKYRLNTQGIVFINERLEFYELEEAIKELE